MSQRYLEDSELWQLASEIAKDSYGLLEGLPEEEKWGMQSKLRTRAFEVSSDIAEAIGSIDPRDAKWHLGMARRSLFGIKNILNLSHKSGMLDAQVDLIVKINNATDMIDTMVIEVTKNIVLWHEELTPPAKDKKI